MLNLILASLAGTSASDLAATIVAAYNVLKGTR